MTAWQVPGRDEREWPFALGLVLDAGPRGGHDGWAPALARQLAVALAALDHGFYLLAAVELDRADVLAAVPVRELVAGLDVDAVFVLGAGPRELAVLEDIAAEERLMLRQVPADALPRGR